VNSPIARAYDLRSRPGLLTALLVLAAALVYWLGTRPLEEKAMVAADQYRRAREERHAQQARLAPLERGEAAVRHASASFSSLSTGPGADLRGVRRAVVTTLRGAKLSGVRLAVRPGRPPVAASVHLVASGTFHDVVELSGQLVRPGSGFILDQVRLSPRSSAVDLELDAFGLERRP
jgi:hypothetical protein